MAAEGWSQSTMLSSSFNPEVSVDVLPHAALKGPKKKGGDVRKKHVRLSENHFLWHGQTRPGHLLDRPALSRPGDGRTTSE